LSGTFVAFGVLAALGFGAIAGCEEPPAGIGSTEAPAPVEQVRGARVTALVGLPQELRATATAPGGAPRPLAEGATLAAGEAVETGPKCEAILTLADGTTAHLGEAGIAALGAGAPDLVLRRGAIAITRPFGGQRPATLGLGAKTLEVASGRASVFVDGDTYTVRVDSGSAALSPGGEPLGAGDVVQIAKGGALRRGAAPFGGWLSERIEPLYGREPRLAVAPAVLRGIGTLSARLPGSGRTNEEALELAAHDVDVVIRDGVALTQIEEAFVNNSGRTVEATYRFALPSSASITRLALEVNGRIEEGEVLERARAKRIFKEIVDDSVRPRDPALLEWERGSTFSMKIFPIQPGETKRVFLSYVEPAAMQGGAARYVYPLGGPAGAPTAGRFSIDVDIQNAHGIASVRTPLYPTDVRAGTDRASVSFSANGYAPSVDFAVEYAVAQKPAEMRVAAQTETNGAAYAMLLASPDAGAAPAGLSRKGKRLLAVVDTSYGTADELHALAAATVLELAATLGRGDEINVLACDSGCRSMAQRFEPIDERVLDRAREFLDDNPPGGASDILGALERAFSLAADGRPTTVVYLGDGVPTAGETDPGRIVDLAARTAPPNVRVQAIGIGPNVDALLLDALAAALGGASYDLSLGEAPAEAAWNVSRRLWSAGLVNVAVEWPVGVRSAYPQRIGFVPADSEVAFFAQLDGGAVSGDVVLRGTTVDGAPVERRYPISVQAPPPAPGFIGRLFAKAHIDHLQLVGGSNQEIIDTSRRMRVASRLTSWIVLENQRMYDRFNVQRTTAGEWDGQAATFTEVPAAEQEQAEAEDDATAAALDALESLGYLAQGESGAATGRGGLAGTLGAGAGGGGKAGGGLGADIGSVAGPSPAAPAKPASKAADADYGDEKRAKREAEESAKAAHDSAAPIAQSAPPAAEPAGGIGTAYGTGAGYGYGAPIAMDDLEDSWRCRPRPVYDIRITRASGAGVSRGQLDALGAEVRARPLSRQAHKKHVGALARAGLVEDALVAADAWRKADPLDGGALAAYADALARQGSRAVALRAYASIAEVDPRKAANHTRVAQAFEALGAFDAAAAHRRAAAALDPKSRDESMLRYLFCLAAARMYALLDVEAVAVLGDRALRNIHDDVLAIRDGARRGVLPEQGAPQVRGELIARLSGVRSPVDLDLAVLDPAGRRVSGLWPRGAVFAELPGAEGETLALKGLANGRYKILVSTANGAAPHGQAVTGTVTVRVRDQRQSFPFSLAGTDAVVAEVRYQKRDAPIDCY
jgi:tetratricopeptide (TPR) repeat protein